MTMGRENSLSTQPSGQPISRSGLSIPIILLTACIAGPLVSTDKHQPPDCASPWFEQNVYSVATQEESNLADEFFPSGTFDLKAKAYDEIARQRVAEQLVAIAEPPLRNMAIPAETYRCTIVRTHDQLLSVRMERRGNLICAVGKLSTGSGFEAGSLASLSSAAVNEASWAAFSEKLDETPLKNSQKERTDNDNVVSFDGDAWVLEGNRGGQYDIVVAYFPEDHDDKRRSMVRTACKFILDQSHLPVHGQLD